MHAQRTIYVTGSIMLQEQLAKKDLPSLEAVLPWGFRYAVMKGVSNYLCLLQLERSMLDPTMAMDGELLDVQRWATETPTGDLGDYDVELGALTRQRVTTTSDECVGMKCKMKEQCFLLRARKAAAQANVVVSNYHLFFADLAIKKDNDGRGILPAYQHVVLDEVHAAPDVARSFFGFELTPGGIQSSASRLMRHAPKAGATLKHAGEAFFDALARYRQSDRYRARLHGPLPSELDWRPIYDELRLGSKAVQDEVKPGLPEFDRKKLQSLAKQLDTQAANLLQGAKAADPDFVYFLKDNQKKGTALAGMPLKVDALLRQHLFQSTAVRSVVCMSATLTANGSFAMMAEELGATGVDTLEVPSPFDWKRNCIALVPPGMPDPGHPSFQAAVVGACEEAILAAGGRTLCLFTSRRQLDFTAAALRNSEVAARYTVLVQGELPRAELVRRFREDVTSVLLGTSSLWEGVDVQGEALSCVVVDKLPFESPDDPIADAMKERRRNYWKERALPRAVIDTRQGFGRLLRTVTDRGCIVLLDARVTTKPYGAKFLPGALPAGVRLVRGDPRWGAAITQHLAVT